jgi:hypothetical protein
MSAAEVFSPEVLADICATARENHARAGRGVLFVQPMPDRSGSLDSQYFKSIDLLKLASSLNKMAGYNLLAVAGNQVGAYQPERQCVLLWMDDDESIHCETIDDPHAG